MSISRSLNYGFPDGIGVLDNEMRVPDDVAGDGSECGRLATGIPFLSGHPLQVPLSLR